MKDKPKVSVIVLTYNHERYIQHALDSILAQKINFKYEVLVGDDASGDATPKILEEYAVKYPDIFKLVLHKKNISAAKNGIGLFERAAGEYIACLDGDDYWTDNEKLKKQVDFLENNKEFIGCAHKCVVVDENNIPDYDESPHWVKAKKIFALKDFIPCEFVPGQSGTLLFRNVITDWSPIATVHPLVGDKTLMLMLLARGNFYVFRDIMSAYRLVINKNGGTNWFSIHHSNPYWQYDAFMRPIKLEEYARSIGINAKIGTKRDYHYTSLVENIIKEPNVKRIKQLAEMTVKSRKPMYCIGLIAKYLILR